MDGRPNRENKAAFLNFSCEVWTLPEYLTHELFTSHVPN